MHCESTAIVISFCRFHHFYFYYPHCDSNPERLGDPPTPPESKLFHYRSTTSPSSNTKKELEHQSDSVARSRAGQKNPFPPRFGARRQRSIVTFTGPWTTWQESILVQSWTGHIRQAKPTGTWPSVGTSAISPAHFYYIVVPPYQSQPI